ncbi:MAG: amidohydrolase family protein [Gammaproteobacteria bacterium]
MHRRRFLSTAIAAGLYVRFPVALAQSYDLIIRGGRIIDPSQHIDTIADIAISNGRIAALQPNISASASDEIDASGRLVVPGLIDIHAHYGRDAEGGHIALADGITAWVDAGSAGANNLGDILPFVRTAPQPARMLINIGLNGTSGADTGDSSLADVEAAKAAIAQNLDYVIGVKARLTSGVTFDDMEVLRRAQQAASFFNLPVMIHMGQSESPMSDILQLLKPGDVVTHMYAPPPNAIVDANGRIYPEVLRARRRGIWFDMANGRIDHLRWDTFDAIMAAGFWPDTLSTDGFSTSRSAPGVVDLPNIMSKLLNFSDMSLSDVVATVTCNAARVFPFLRDKGTLHVGASADIAVLELREGSYEFLDNYENLLSGRQRLFPVDTLLAGRQAPRV